METDEKLMEIGGDWWRLVEICHVPISNNLKQFQSISINLLLNNLNQSQAISSNLKQSHPETTNHP
jgi:hypothetical protein